MALIGTYYLIEPDKWLMTTHGDVREAKRRAEQWFEEKGTYEDAEQFIGGQGIIEFASLTAMLEKD